MSVALRRVVLFGAPALAYLAGMLHPDHVIAYGGPWLYLGVHLAWPFLACMLAWMFILLVEGLESGFATAARVLAIPFAVAYTSFTVFAGVGVGAFVWKANELPPDQRPTASALIENVIHSSIGSPLRWIAAGLWLATAFAVVFALRGRAPVGGLVLFAAGACAFAYRHERPWGAAAMVAILAAVIWIELRPGVVTGARQATP